MYEYDSRTKDGVKPRRYAVREANIRECPKSVILRDGGWANELAMQYLRSERLERSLGEICFGPDPSVWPAWIEEVVLVFKRQKAMQERALQEDLMRNRG